jgi:hypothetical protein
MKGKKMEERLSAAIIVQAVKDLEKEGYRDDVMVFAKSRWFEVLAEGVGIPHHKARNQLLTGTYNKNVNFRAAYR